MLTNDKALEIARSWIGTPYRHQCSLKGEGTDCLGLLRGVYRELYSTGDPKEMPNYSMSWNEHLSTDPLIEATREFLDEFPLKAHIPGKVLLFVLLFYYYLLYCLGLYLSTLLHKHH